VNGRSVILTVFLGLAFLASAVAVSIFWERRTGTTQPQENENAEWLTDVVWIFDYGPVYPTYVWNSENRSWEMVYNREFENFVVYTWWPDNAEVIRVESVYIIIERPDWKKNPVCGYSWSHDFGWQFWSSEEVRKIILPPEWVFSQIPRFKLVEMDTPVGRRTVAEVKIPEYWENGHYAIGVKIKIPRKVAENREFTGIDLGEYTDLLGEKRWWDKTFFYFDWYPRISLKTGLHLNLGSPNYPGRYEGAYMDTGAEGVVVTPGKWYWTCGGLGSEEITPLDWQST